MSLQSITNNILILNSKLTETKTSQTQTSKLFLTVLFCENSVHVSWLTAFFCGCDSEEKPWKAGSDVQRFCQPDEPWQEKGSDGETGCITLEDNPVWWAEDQKSWFANFCIALKWPWNDTMDCKQQQTCRLRRGPAVGGFASWKVHTLTQRQEKREYFKLSWSTSD